MNSALRKGVVSVSLAIQLALSAAFFASPVLLSAQDSPTSAATTNGRKDFLEHCAACHGTDARGTSRGPSLAGNRRLRSRSLQQLRGVIHNGIPAGGMPAFDLPTAQLDALVEFVHALNSPAIDAAAPGDPQSGERFFFGQGGCSSCHMVDGHGKPIGPDLSNVGRELSLDELREALLNPAARITPGYELVRVQLRDGPAVRGFARNRTNFGIELQDLDGKFHSLAMDRISTVDESKESLMNPVKASAKELDNLMAYLSRLGGVHPGLPVVSPPPAQDAFDWSRLVHPQPGDWATYDGVLGGNRYSALAQINTTNVKQLVVKWMSPIQQFGLEATPLVADGIMYVSGPNQAYALDAVTGNLIWQYSRPRTPGLVGDASLGTNRGMALLGDKVFMVTDNAHLLALNRVSGHLVWESVMPDEQQHYGSTVAPLVVKNKVIAGVSGADWGIRGFIAAYKAETGERAWRFWTIPAKGDPYYDTWKGGDPKYGGGGTWVTGSYDPETDTLYWGTATPWPVSDDRSRGGDNLFTDSVLAIDPNTGKLKWHYQYTPHDTHAWDSTEPHVVVDTQYAGKPRKLLLHADRNGFFYVFDRSDGQLLLGTNFEKVTWASGIGPDR
ncbi:MAG TPA: PQQ-binding-like beta-propeller repeat protein, partial [Bryobacteraceae bacterium]|nr:PQQ-binding-like beta-propeller repeat protein [Bryobacteraceae bacterium]